MPYCFYSSLASLISSSITSSHCSLQSLHLNVRLLPVPQQAPQTTARPSFTSLRSSGTARTMLEVNTLTTFVESHLGQVFICNILTQKPNAVASGFCRGFTLFQRKLVILLLIQFFISCKPKSESIRCLSAILFPIPI